MGLRLRHNKKRNPALVYEFLVRHMSKCLINEDRAGAEKAVEITRKYFKKGSPLYEELSLFKKILDNKVKSRESAFKLISNVCEAAKLKNSRDIDSEKSKLIKEINYTFNDDSFYDYKVPNYTVYASIQSLLNESRSKKGILEDVEKIKLEESVSDFLISEEKSNLREELKVDPTYNNSVLKLVLKKFHEKYKGKLTESQNRLLIQYVSCLISGDNDSLKSSVLQEGKRIKESLLSITDEKINKDEGLNEKLKECYKQFLTMDLSEINESKMIDLLQYVELAEELRSNE